MRGKDENSRKRTRSQESNGTAVREKMRNVPTQTFFQTAAVVVVVFFNSFLFMFTSAVYAGKKFGVCHVLVNAKRKTTIKKLH